MLTSFSAVSHHACSCIMAFYNMGSKGEWLKASPNGLQAYLPVLCAGHDLLQQRYRCGRKVYPPD